MRLASLVNCASISIVSVMNFSSFNRTSIGTTVRCTKKFANTSGSYPKCSGEGEISFWDSVGSSEGYPLEPIESL